MNIESTLEKLHDAVSRAQKISSKNLTLPILENVLLVCQNNTLTIRTTNLHVGVEITLPVKVHTEGQIAVNLDVFANILGGLKGEHKITLKVVETSLHIETEKSQMDIKLFPHEDFPTLPQPEDETNIFSVPIESLVEGVRSVVYSASSSDIKPEISSVYIYTENNEMVFAATDSFRLAEKRMVVKGVADFPGIIVPVKNIHECMKVFAGIKEKVKMYINKTQLTLVAENIFFTSRVVDGNYPDYQQIIPTEFETEAVVLKEDLTQTLKITNVFSDNYNQVHIGVDPEKKGVVVTSRNNEVGENSSFIEAAITGGAQETHLNHRYVSDVFQSISGDSLQLQFAAKNKPLVIRGIGEPGFLYLIMPMNR